MKVRELRMALEQVPDDVDVIVANDRSWGYVYATEHGGEAELNGGEQLSPVFVIATDDDFGHDDIMSIALHAHS